jgi:hypothetical protein
MLVAWGDTDALVLVQVTDQGLVSCTGSLNVNHKLPAAFDGDLFDIEVMKPGHMIVNRAEPFPGAVDHQR